MRIFFLSEFKSFLENEGIMKSPLSLIGKKDLLANPLFYVCVCVCVCVCDLKMPSSRLTTLNYLPLWCIGLFSNFTKDQVNCTFF